MLALGIGTATAVFSVVDGVVLRGLPFDDADRVVAVVEHDTRAAETLGGGLTSAPTFLDWRRLQAPFERLAAVGNASFRTRTSMGEPVEAAAQSVTWEFFPVLRVAPILGRAFVFDDETVGRHHVVILGHAYWQQQFGGAPDVVGRTLDLDDERWEIVGVAPAGFTYPVGTSRPTDLYVPLAFSATERSRDSGHAYFYSAIGRLKPGVTVSQANREMARLAAILDRQHPDWSPGRTAHVVTLQERLGGRVRPWMLLLLSAVGLVLLVACINVASLMLVRTMTRRCDMSVRAGLFATSFVRLMRVDSGFDPNGVLALAVGAPADPRSPRSRAAGRGSEIVEQVVDAVGRVPGVEPAGAVTGGLPLSGKWSRSSVELPGRGELPGADNDIDVRRVSPDYLKVLRVPLLRGRHLTDIDRASAPLVVLVNDAAARKYWPGQDAIGQRRFLIALTALLGFLGLVIASAGVYGVMSYTVTRQIGEIGLRMALGATPVGVLRQVLRQASVLLGAGLAIGGAGAWMLGASIRAFLFGVQPDDVGVYGAAVVALALAGLLASALPARRAASVDPLVALRHE